MELALLKQLHAQGALDGIDGMVPQLSEEAADDFDRSFVDLLLEPLRFIDLRGLRDISRNILLLQEQELEPLQSILVRRNRIAPSGVFGALSIEKLRRSLVDV